MRAFTVVDCEQRSPEWQAARLGLLTGTSAHDMLATTQKGEFTSARRNLRIRLCLERITGRSLESTYGSKWMQMGTEAEPDAVATYEALTGTVVARSGFLRHTDLAAGVSLDGHVGDFDGLVEAKCPIPATHLDYLRTGKVPLDYLRQVQHALWLTGAAWCDWLSYQPAFPEPLQTKLVRVVMTEAERASYELMVRTFLREVDAEEAEVRGMAVAS